MPVPSLSLESSLTIKQSYLRAKRLLDILFPLLILVPLCFIIVVVAILIRLDSEGPVFYRQKRIGLNGEEFTLYKLRTMYLHNDDSLHRKAVAKYISGEKLSGDGTGNISYKLTEDPRVTRVGRFLRKTSLDELPQFFNVLHGEMSLVGPRPPLPYEVEVYSPHDWLRLSGKPGLTGIWQVYGRSRTTFQSMVQMDIEYLQQQSLWEDLKLIVLTVPVVFLARGGA